MRTPVLLALVLLAITQACGVVSTLLLRRDMAKVEVIVVPHSAPIGIDHEPFDEDYEPI